MKSLALSRDAVGFKRLSRPSTNRVGGARNEAITSVRSDAAIPLTRVGLSRTGLSGYAPDTFAAAISSPAAASTTPPLPFPFRVSPLQRSSASTAQRSRYGRTSLGISKVSVLQEVVERHDREVVCVTQGRLVIASLGVAVLRDGVLLKEALMKRHAELLHEMRLDGGVREGGHLLAEVADVVLFALRVGELSGIGEVRGGIGEALQKPTHL
eukprot:scaffold2602_cov246-Pinguiococcus_pyrenoidosus.AAC.3